MVPLTTTVHMLNDLTLTPPTTGDKNQSIGEMTTGNAVTGIGLVLRNNVLAGLIMAETVVSLTEAAMIETDPSNRISGIGSHTDILGVEIYLKDVQDPLLVGRYKKGDVRDPLPAGRRRNVVVQGQASSKPVAFPSTDETRRPRSPSPPLNEPAASSTTTTQEEGAIPHKMVPSSTPPGLSTAGEDLPSALSSPAAPTQVIKNIPQDAVLPFDVEISGRTGPSKELVDTSSEQEHPVQLRSTTLSLVPNLSSNNDLIIISPPPREPMADRQAAASDAKLQDKLPTLSSPQLRTQLSSPSNRIRDKTPTSPKQRQARSPSPPKQSRNSGPLGPQAVFIGRGSRSPPRGPRNTSGTHPRGNATPTGPASSYFTGPRGQRRPSALTNPLLVPSPGPSTPQTQSPIPPPLPAPMEDVHVINALAPEATRIPPPIIPVVTLTASLTPDLDKEMANLQAHRARLASEYANFAKEARRALHELDMAAIDLRAAELRRKVADNQHNQAKSGVLGIDYVPTPS
ncbi:hypothetical protein H0H87_012858 [Tephrocybe sp. NHM501043]|nr:hypothetical protein H0H87_012858 [Tephrocybe sp. NHM501043]